MRTPDLPSLGQHCRRRGGTLALTWRLVDTQKRGRCDVVNDSFLSSDDRNESFTSSRAAGPGAGQARVQAMPLRLNAEGAAGSPECVAWKPMPIEPPAGIAAL